MKRGATAGSTLAARERGSRRSQVAEARKKRGKRSITCAALGQPVLLRVVVEPGRDPDRADDLEGIAEAGREHRGPALLRRERCFRGKKV